MPEDVHGIVNIDCTSATVLLSSICVRHSRHLHGNLRSVISLKIGEFQGSAIVIVKLAADHLLAGRLT